MHNEVQVQVHMNIHVHEMSEQSCVCLDAARTMNENAIIHFHTYANACSHAGNAARIGQVGVKVQVSCVSQSGP